MVDFRARLAAKKPSKPISPVDLYETLDRASDKGPLRPSQHGVLEAWHSQHRAQRDVIIKLHTGQGKTLIGLLMLQSKLNEGVGPALYLCPNRYLVEQTENQAKQFGIRVLTSEKEESLPPDFLNSECIYVATSQKLFNGLTKFKLGAQGIELGAVVLDDCHAITDLIREKASLHIPKNNSLYQAIISLFSPSLAHQGAGTFEDIKAGKSASTLRVPYWDVIDKASSLLDLLATSADDEAIKFSWPLLRDSLEACDVYVSGDGIEIAPIAIPMDLFSSFDKAKHRIFMSATVTDDAFLVRSLGLDPTAVSNPITFSKEKWSGEKMVLLPELIDRSLDRGFLMSRYGKKQEKRKFGVVCIVTSNKSAAEWAANGAALANSENIFGYVDSLRQKVTAEMVVIANRYDGIDLPDAACRILIIDGLPTATSPSERYLEKVDYNGCLNKERIFRKLEQGLGRSVRGEKDFSVILLTGSGMVHEVRSVSNRKYLSSQTRAQIEIGIEVSKMAQEDVEKHGAEPREALRSIINKMLGRDDDWKEFYKGEMDSSAISHVQPRDIDRHTADRLTDKFVRTRNFAKAANGLQALIDSIGGKLAKEEKGVLLERLAHLTYFSDKKKAHELQISAHGLNPYLLFPKLPPAIDIEVRNVKQSAAVAEFIAMHDGNNSLLVHVEEVCRNFTFGQSADQFEQTIKVLGEALGFSSTRPDREYRAGPDNIWSQAGDVAICIECKSEVAVDRAEITKAELAQLLASTEWTKRNYHASSVLPLIIIPPRMATREATASADCRVLREGGISKLRRGILEFYKELVKAIERSGINHGTIDTLLAKYHLTATEIFQTYAETIKYHEFRP